MFYLLFLFLCCKDTIKSNNRQIFKGKSYYIVYYLTFINNKIKDYYIINYFFGVIHVIVRCIVILYIYIIIYKERTNESEQGKSKRANRTGRENQGEGCRRHLCQFLASLLLRLLHPPSTPSPAAQPSPRRTITEWNGGHLVRFWAMSSPHLATTSPANSSQQRQGSASTVCNPPRLVLVLFHFPLFLQVVRKGRAKEQTKQKEREPGRRMPPPSSPVPRLSSVPSDVFTVHTIASRSLSHQVTPSPKGRAATPSASGRCYRHTSPPHRQRTAATGHRLDVLPSSPPLPRPRPLPSGGDGMA